MDCLQYTAVSPFLFSFSFKIVKNIHCLFLLFTNFLFWKKYSQEFWLLSWLFLQDTVFHHFSFKFRKASELGLRRLPISFLFNCYCIVAVTSNIYRINRVFVQLTDSLTEMYRRKYFLVNSAACSRWYPSALATVVCWTWNHLVILSESSVFISLFFFLLTEEF